MTAFGQTSVIWEIRRVRKKRNFSFLKRGVSGPQKKQVSYGGVGRYRPTLRWKFKKTRGVGRYRPTFRKEALSGSNRP